MALFCAQHQPLAVDVDASALKYYMIRLPGAFNHGVNSFILSFFAIRSGSWLSCFQSGYLAQA